VILAFLKFFVQKLIRKKSHVELAVKQLSGFHPTPSNTKYIAELKKTLQEQMTV